MQTRTVTSDPTQLHISDLFSSKQTSSSISYRKQHEVSHTHTAFKKHIKEQLGLESPPHYYTDGSKIGNILHTRLRNEMSHLNSHLFQLQKSDTPACSCGHQMENVKHFILACPKYIPERNVLFDNLSSTLHCDFRNIPSYTQCQILMYGQNLGGGDGRAVAKFLQVYIFQTRRFDCD